MELQIPQTGEGWGVLPTLKEKMVIPHILKVSHLTKSFGKMTAVHDLSFGLDRGEIMGIMGPNGAGKTTLFNLITGEIKPNQGSVVFEGTDITHTSTYERCRAGIARTSQIPRPFQSMTVFENLLVGAVYGASAGGKQARDQCEAILEKTGMISKRNNLAGSLPLLDRKRLELAKALSTNPALLLVDEVAGGLSEQEVEEILSIIHSARGAGMSVLWVEHIMMAMKRGPDRILVMNYGEELFCGKPEDAFASEEIQRVYLGAEED